MNRVSVRALRPDEWPVFRALRLQALQEHPSVYLNSYDNALTVADAMWRSTLEAADKCVFALFDNDRPIGLAGVFRWQDDPTGHTAVMGMDYIEPGHRGNGLSRFLYEARIDWALGRTQFTRLVISHREGNEASRRAIQALGFEYVGRERIRWPDGSEADVWNYALDLETIRSQQSG